MCVCVCVCVCARANSLQSRLTLCDPMDCSPQAPLSVGFPREEYWSRFPFPPPGDLPDSGIEPVSIIPAELAGAFFTTSATWDALGGLNVATEIDVSNTAKARRTAQRHREPINTRKPTTEHCTALQRREQLNQPEDSSPNQENIIEPQ